MEFNGHNYFYGNIGGGITLMNARLNVRGELLFKSNVAIFGGGIAMDDTCLVSY
jgi:predicted outer membrane repeat protein